MERNNCSPSPEAWRNPETYAEIVLDGAWHTSILRTIGATLNSIHSYYDRHNMMPVLAPVTAQNITSPMALGSDSEPVQIDLDGIPTYLVDSMQFHLEYLLRKHPVGVYYVMPSFRNERHDPRHLNQFFHIEAEIIGTLDDVIRHIEGLIFSTTSAITINEGKYIRSITDGGKHLDDLLTNLERGIERLKFQTVMTILEISDENFSFYNNQVIGLTPQGEQRLLARCGGSAVWVTHLPRLGVPFYQADADDDLYSECADLLMGLGETVGCGERHSTHEECANAMSVRNVPAQDYEWYLSLKATHPLQTSGFGMGLERYLAFIYQHADIRDLQLIPRLNDIISIP